MRNKGFTVIEMIVVIAIFLAISAVVLFNYSSFSTNVSLQNISQDIALTVRKAQVFALGTKIGTLHPSGQGEIEGYGIHFNTNDSRSFTLFADQGPSGPAPGNTKYDKGPGCGHPQTECVEEIRIETSDCLRSATLYAGGTRLEAPFSGCTTFTPGTPPPLPQFSFLEVLFNRPNPDARICVYQGGGGSVCGDRAFIEVVSAKGATKTISIYATGLISVQ